MTLSFPSFQSFPIDMGMTTRDSSPFLSGTSDLEDPKNVSTLQEILSPSKYWIFPEQIHGSKVQFVSAPLLQGGVPFQRIPGADGLLTDIPQMTLFILTADCLPIFFLVPNPLTIGLIHAGWRGTKATISQLAVERLREVTRQSPKTFRVGLGPCIRDCCYEVGGELKRSFGETLTEREAKYYLDLVTENRRQLEKAGIREENIFEDSRCTFCHSDHLHSYRRDKEKAGRMVSWIRIRNVLA